MQAIILAGGFGTRLKGVVSDVPKPLAPVAGEPFLGWLLSYMAAQGVRDVVLSVHHQAALVQQSIGEHFAGMRIRYSVEEKPLGTGGAVKLALPRVKQDAPVLVLNGDSLIMFDYKAMLATHEQSNKPATLATLSVPNTARYSKLTIDNGMITDYALLGDVQPGNISAGLYFLQPDIFSGYDVPEAFSIERDFFAPNVPHIKPAAFSDISYFIDIGVPADYARAQSEIPKLLSLRTGGEAIHLSAAEKLDCRVAKGSSQ